MAPCGDEPAADRRSHRRLPGVAFLVTLLASEAALSLPDEHLGAHPVATFYAAHRGVIVTLQVVGLIAIAVRLWTARDGSARSQPPSRCTA